MFFWVKMIYLFPSKCLFSGKKSPHLLLHHITIKSNKCDQYLCSLHLYNSLTVRLFLCSSSQARGHGIDYLIREEALLALELEKVSFVLNLSIHLLAFLQPSNGTCRLFISVIMPSFHRQLQQKIIGKTLESVQDC